MPAHGHGDVVVADHLTGGGVESLPAGAGQINFRPRMRGALAPRAGSRAQVATDKPRRQAQVAAGFDEQGRGIPAGAAAFGQGGRRRLDPRLFALLVGEATGDGFISICKVKTPAFRRVDFISSPYW